MDHTQSEIYFAEIFARLQFKLQRLLIQLGSLLAPRLDIRESPLGINAYRLTVHAHTGRFRETRVVYVDQFSSAVDLVVVDSQELFQDPRC